MHVNVSVLLVNENEMLQNKEIKCQLTKMK